ncbi:MAG: type II secretion system F family protein [Nitrospirales bacterium]|nr:type II secretion system F family protein [Nitrospira sp.]MDR4459279.1 type II secretion system F family protein [Nitrospirales bacterium]MDR4483244.1 type II secretion system F family protein [Nitrospirales bacterium]
MTVAISIGIFLSIILFVEGAYYCYHQYLNPQNKNLKRRLRGGSGRPGDFQKTQEAPGILRNRKMSDIPWIQKLLGSMTTLSGLERLLQQANSQMPVGVFFLLSGVLGGAGLLIATFQDYGMFAAMGLSLLGMSLPLLQMKRKRKRRFKEFERQLPEALDLMARALRAGHAFSVGMKMIGDEFPDPIGPEFSRTVEEISFGIDVPQAMNNLNGRVISTDLKFFVTALVVQRETGGNLAEIIEAISRLIRQRFELLGRVKALSAEGRLSGIVLFCMPIVMSGVLYWLNESYMRVLFEDELGQMMAAGSALLMIIGAYVMKNMCDIKV